VNIAAQLDTLTGIYQRHSVRSYTPDPVSHVKVERLLRAAVRAPTAMHQEPWAFAVVQNRDVLRRYSERAKAMLLVEQAATSTSAADQLSLQERLLDPEFNIFYDAGTLVVICRKNDASFAEADCWLAAENLMLAALAEGLGSCCIGLALPALNKAEARRELGIPEGGAAVAAIIVGVPGGPITHTTRKPPDILSWRT